MMDAPESTAHLGGPAAARLYEGYRAYYEQQLRAAAPAMPPFSPAER